jgi:hypothetical protein
MKTHPFTRRRGASRAKPGRDHWWWRARRLQRALQENPRLDHFFSWKVKGRRSPSGPRWSPAQRLAIETSLWLYELDARISRRYLFGQPAHLLPPAKLDAVVAFASEAAAVRPATQPGRRRRTFRWEWIECFDRRDAKQAGKLTPAERNGIIAAMKYCVEYFLRD